MYLDLSGSTITEIPENFEAFMANPYQNNMVVGITIPDSVTTIERGAFYSWTNLLNVTIPNSVTTISRQAFMGCTSLTSITIPNSVTTIGSRAFYNCTNLTSVTFEGTIPWSGFNNDNNYPVFPGSLRSIFYAEDPENGTPGTYTRPDSTSATWTKQ